MTSTLKVDAIQGSTTAGSVAMPSGHVIQVVNANSYGSAGYSLSASTEQNLLSCSITPKFSNSHMILDVRWNFSPKDSNTDFGLAMRREIGGSLTGYVNGSSLPDGTRGDFSVGGVSRECFWWIDDAPVRHQYSAWSCSSCLKDTYSGTDERTYQMTLGTTATGKTIYWNQAEAGITYAGGITSITIMEIAQ